MALLMRLYNEIISDLSPPGRRYSNIIDRMGDGEDAFDLANDWCRGYSLGIAMREDEWREAMEAPELQSAFLPILSIAHPQKSGLHPVENFQAYQAFVDELPECAVQIAEWWRRRRVAEMHGGAQGSNVGTIRRIGPKISPNASCPCGSGKKYKRCCSTLRAV